MVHLMSLLMQLGLMNAVGVVNMNNSITIKNKLIYLYVILIAYIPSAYMIPQLNLNADRLFFTIMSGFGLLVFVTSGKFKLSKIQYFLIIYLLIIILNNIFIGQPQLMSIYIGMLLILIASKDLRAESLIKAINIAFYAFVFWMFFGVVHFFTSGPLVQLPFSQFLPDFFDKNLEHAELISYSYNIFPRVSFPYATPPHLAAVGSLYFFFYGFLNQLYKYDKRSAYGISKSNINFGFFFSIMIIFSTVSRTGIAMLVAGMSVNFLFRINRLVSISRLFKLIFGIIVFLVFAGLSFYASQLNTELNFIFSRIFDFGNAFDSSGDGSHLSIRSLGIQLFQNLPLANKIFGIGYLNIVGLHYHSSFLTALVEIGIIGFLSFIWIVLYPAIRTINILSNKSVHISKIKAQYIMVTSSALFTAHIVYEMPYIQGLWFFWSLVLLLSRETKSE